MVDYCPTNIAENPSCLHGPTLLFSRKKNERKFFACSAYRNRKKCPFFQLLDTPRKASRDLDYSSVVQDDCSFSECGDDSIKRKKIYCFTCDLQIAQLDVGEHENHNLSEENTGFSSCPSLVMKTKEESKGESQFHFCDSTLNTLVEFFKQQNIVSILCVGCPRLHEYLMNDDKNFSSMLLDIDKRYNHFYDSSQFQLFNMFNCHFFDPEGQESVKSFIRRSSRLAIIVDPPFGGRIEALEYTLKRLISLQKNESIEDADILILLILPYFMETAVQSSFPNMSMLDYKVEYKNHRRFRKRESSSGVKGSAVRIFSNYSPSRFILPAEEGYKYCVVCDRWVYKENKHCYECKACTSKNGGRYKHCNECNKCVKGTWKHCKSCRICKLPDHHCSSDLSQSDEERNSESRTFKKKRKYPTRKSGIRKKGGKKIRNN